MAPKQRMIETWAVSITNRERFEPIIETLLCHAAEGSPLRMEGRQMAAVDYTCPTYAVDERRRLFVDRPQAVALSCDLPQPGAQLTRDQLDIPLLLTRDHDGTVHALANVCAHRAAQVVADGAHNGPDCRRRLSCPYHGWTYDLSGSLVGLPDQASFPDWQVPQPGLRRLPVYEDAGLIWVTPNLDAETCEPALDGLADEIGEYDAVGHHHWRSHRFHLDLNWKLVIDTFLEGYHFPTLHRTTVGPLFISNLGHVASFGPHLREVLPRRSFVELADQPRDAWDVVPHSAIIYVLFPNTVLVVQIDHLETWRVYPDRDDPARSVADLDFYVPELPTTDSALRHWENNWKLTIDTVITEDFAAMAGVQRGLASGAVEHITAGANEPALAAFHRALEDAKGPDHPPAASP